MTTERGQIAIVASFVTGIVIRFWFTFTTFGTNDAAFMRIWAELAERHGIPGAYAHHPLLNHPPLALWILRTLSRIGDLPDQLRLMQIAADAISFACLLKLTKGQRWPAIVFFLSPVAIFISGFHCNTDSTMVCLILVAAVLMNRTPLGGGMVLALATGIKIVPLFLLPLFLVNAGRRWWQCLIGFAVTFGAIFAVMAGSPAAARNVFGYAAQAWWWGWPALALRIESAIPFAARIGIFQVLYGRWVVAVVVAAVAALFLRRKSELPAAIGLTFLAVLFVSPALGVQYLLWPLPFLPFLFKRWETLTLHAAMSLFLAAMYTEWSGGWPWTYADSLRLPWPHFEQLVRAGLVVWAILGCASIVGFVRLVKGPAVVRAGGS